jgi:hypothetical protein
MTMISPGGSGISPSSSGSGRTSPITLIVIVLVGVLVAAALGFVVFRAVRGGSPTATPTPGVCPQVTTTPGAGLPKTAAVTINVYNATQRSGLARTTASQLRSSGFVVISVANDPLSKKIPGVAELRYGKKGAANAKLLAFYLPSATLVLDKRADSTVDVVLGETFAGVISPDVVAKELKSPSVGPNPTCKPSG